MRRAFLTLFLALPASAQSVADFGGTGCRLIPVEGQSQVADVICHNAVTSGEAWSEGAMVIRAYPSSRSTVATLSRTVTRQVRPMLSSNHSQSRS